MQVGRRVRVCRRVSGVVHDLQGISVHTAVGNVQRLRVAVIDIVVHGKHRHTVELRGDSLYTGSMITVPELQVTLPEITNKPTNKNIKNNYDNINLNGKQKESHLAYTTIHLIHISCINLHINFAT